MLIFQRDGVLEDTGHSLLLLDQKVRLILVSGPGELRSPLKLRATFSALTSISPGTSSLTQTYHR